MKKISKFLLLSAFFAGIFGVALQNDKAVLKTEAATEDRLLYFERARVEGLPGFWITDEIKLHYWSDATGDVLVQMDKDSANEDLFTVTIPGTILDSGGGFRFAAYDRSSTHNQTQWNDATTYRNNGHNYFLLTKYNGEGKELSTESSIFGETIEVTKYRGEAVIGTDEVPADENYTPSFVYQQGFKLEGWFTDAELTVPYVVGKLSDNISLYGKYVSVEDYYVYFRKPEGWGSDITVHYFHEGTGILLGGIATNWPGDAMTDVMGGGHGYVVKIDAGYNPNTIIFNDGNIQSGNTPLVAEKIYTYSGENNENPATPHDFEYRLFMNWKPWDDGAEDFAEHEYLLGNGAQVAIKAGDTVKMNISSHIYAPFSKLTGNNLATYFEADPDDDNYKALVSGVYKFTYNESYGFKAATDTKTAQIDADNSTISFELVTLENDKIAAVDQRIADINTCIEYGNHADYVTFVTDVLGANGMTLISEQSQAKLALMSRYIVSPPPVVGDAMANGAHSTSISVVLIIGLIGLTSLAGFYFLQKKKYS